MTPISVVQPKVSSPNIGLTKDMKKVSIERFGLIHQLVEENLQLHSENKKKEELIDILISNLFPCSYNFHSCP
jgi:hypothetical protein